MKNTVTTRDLCQAALMTVLTVALSQISIPLPFTPIPLSLGLLAPYMTGVLLRPSGALLAQVAYLLLGAAGLPVFHNFTGGVGHMVGPTGGFLFAYPLVAVLTACVVSVLERSRKCNAAAFQSKPVYLAALGAGCLGCLVLLYLCGALWFAYITGVTLPASMALTVLPFIPLDLIKILFCVLCVIPLRTRLAKAYLVN